MKSAYKFVVSYRDEELEDILPENLRWCKDGYAKVRFCKNGWVRVGVYHKGSLIFTSKEVYIRVEDSMSLGPFPVVVITEFPVRYEDI